MTLPFGRTNFGLVSVATLYTASNTVIALATNDGARLPTPSTDGPYPLAWWDATTYPEGPDADPNREVVWVGSRSGDTLVVSRGAESAYGGGAASTKNTSGSTYKMLLGWTAKTVEQVEDRLVDTIRVSSATMGFYASGSNEITATVASGNLPWTATQTTFVVNHPLVSTATASEGLIANALYADSLPKAIVTFNASQVFFRVNVATVARNGTGDYTITFSTPFADANYAVVTGWRRATNNDGLGVRIHSQSAQAVQVKLIGTTADGAVDYEFTCLTVFGAQ